MITINASSTALMAQNNLSNTQDALTDNMLQLSTGKRINSAADDAAGLQITNRMETQISGLDQAQRNANDAISMAQTAEGAMQETTDIMNRMRDLSLQSANDTNTLSDRQAMQEEVNQLVDEIDDIASNTDFAGINLLDGSAKDMTFQVGADANETISFSIDEMSSTALKGSVESATVGIDALEVGDFTTGTAAGTGTLTTATDVDVTIGEDTYSVSAAAGDTQTEVVKALNDELKDTDVSAQLDENGNVELYSVGNGSEAALNAVSIMGTVDPAATPTPGTPTKNAAVVDGGTTSFGLNELDLTTSAGAQIAVEVLDQTMATVDEERAELGAVQNRLESKVDNLSNIEENMAASQSQMLDADFAQQTTEMTSNQMLMQSGASVLTQAKSMPQYANMLMG